MTLKLLWNDLTSPKETFTILPALERLLKFFFRVLKLYCNVCVELQDPLRCYVTNLGQIVTIPRQFWPFISPSKENTPDAVFFQLFPSIQSDVIATMRLSRSTKHKPATRCHQPSPEYYCFCSKSHAQIVCFRFQGSLRGTSFELWCASWVLFVCRWILCEPLRLVTLLSPVRATSLIRDVP